jgi:hypothetical protein
VAPLNPDLDQCCTTLAIGREVKIPRHLVIRTDPMPAPKKASSGRARRPKKAGAAQVRPPKAVEEAPAPTEEPESAPSAPADEPPPIIGPR